MTLYLHETARSARYSPDFARIYGNGDEESFTTLRDKSRSWGEHHVRCRGTADCPLWNAQELAEIYPGRSFNMPIEDMPFVSNTMREGAKGYRSRGGVDLRYWSSGDREVPWDKWEEQKASESWSGYGAWNEWSGFRLGHVCS